MPAREKMTVHVPDRFKAANAFWIGLGKIGLTPAAVLNQARLPLTVYDGKKNLVTTAQFFALWRAVGEVSGDPAAGLKIATQIDVGNRPPSTMAAYYARDYRDALTRLARFKQDRKSTRLNSSHSQISYAVFCLKKKKEHGKRPQRPKL